MPVFKKLSDPNRLNALPLVLAGPIVRHTTQAVVSVWIALKEPGTLTLKIFENDQKTGVARSGSCDTVALGAHLHIALITVDCVTKPLSLGILYYYDIDFFTTNHVGSSLSTTTVLYGGINKITYPAASLPSFVLPPADINRLRIAHGSCRKPHGSDDGDPDALSILDKEIGDNLKDVKNRPQLLFLTGDQVYADDVADVLLFMIQDAGTALIRLTEEMPAAAGWPSDKMANALLLGNRAELTKAFGFTSYPGILNKEAPKSHLLYLAEFYGMYLFSFSDALWPTNPNLFPSYEDISQINSNVPKDQFNQELSSVKVFYNSLHLVQRALANITTYMICDDHEITDDWFYRKYWCDNTLKAENKIARRVMHNGLAAYAMFQGWGNTPDDDLYDKSHDNLPAKLAVLSPFPNELQPPKPASVWAITETLLLPTLAKSTSEEYHLTGGPKWHYQLVYDRFNVVVLDTRTRRTFPSNKGTPGLINVFGLGMHDELPVIANPTSEFTIVVSPAPVMGKALIEKVQEIGGGGISLGGLIKIGSPEGVQAFLDHEAWGAAAYTYQNFLYRLLQYEKVILLSGDVHYAYSNITNYWNNRPDPNEPKKGVILQLCSSPLKNKDLKSKIPGYMGVETTLSRKFVGWRMKGGDVGSKPPDWYYENIFLVDTIHTSRLINQQQPIPLTQVTMYSSQNRFVTQHNLGVIKFKRINNEVVVTHILKFAFNQHAEVTIHETPLELPSGPFPTF